MIRSAIKPFECIDTLRIRAQDNPAASRKPDVLTTAIDIVVPAYRDFDATRRCIESVFASKCKSPFRLLVVNDDSPEPQVHDWLANLASSGRLDLIVNTQNEGFVRSVNKAMALHPDRDAILLNSDCEVAGDWVDRLIGVAALDPRIGTITPLSNNASICSYPIFNVENDLPSGWTLAELDGLAATVNSGEVADLPTAVGSCMYIRRACWEGVGGFDAETFGLGYGEECDFSMRASDAGWRNVLAANVFVYHQGSASFGSARAQRIAHAERVVQERHPTYGPLVSEFLETDPASHLRLGISRARADRSQADACQVMDEVIADLAEQRAFFRNRLDNVRSDLTAANIANSTLEGELNTARLSFAELEEALERAERFVRAREADIATLTSERDRLAFGLDGTPKQNPAYIVKKLVSRLRRWLQTSRNK